MNAHPKLAIRRLETKSVRMSLGAVPALRRDLTRKSHTHKSRWSFAANPSRTLRQRNINPSGLL